MHFSRKHLAIIALVVILAVTNVTLAVQLYMTKSVNISGGVQTVGTIEVYDEDGTTPLTSYDFPLWNPGEGGLLTKNFFINNTGNVMVYVYWNISSSSIVWTQDYGGEGYENMEDSYIKYTFYMYKNYAEAQRWRPDEAWASPNAVGLDVGKGKMVTMELLYTGEPATAGTFTLVTSFYARNA